MIKIIFFTFILLSSYSCSSSKLLIDKTNTKNSQSAQEKPYVLLISIDGYRYDYTKKYKPKNIQQFIKKGTYSKGLIPIYPSKTFPNHYAIATGMYAENHGLISNHFYSKQKKKLYSLRNRKTVQDGSWYKGVPLWVLAEKQQMLTASYFFVGTDANILGIHPHYYYNYEQSVPHSSRIKQVVDWFNLDPKIRPHFVTLYFSDVDSAGHHYGPNASETKNAVLKVDRSLGLLFQKLQKSKTKKINIIIVSDHGMQTIESSEHFSYLSDFINLKNIISTGGGSHFNIYVKEKKMLQSIYNKLKKIPNSMVYLKSNIPKKLHYFKNEAIGDIIISAKSNHYILKEKSSKNFLKNYYRKGTHGYNPYTTKTMKGIFYAKGPQIKSLGEIKSFKNIHIYPFISQILGLHIKHKIDGKLKVLKFLLK